MQSATSTSRLRWLGAVLVLSLVAAACGGSDDGGSGSTAAGDGTPKMGGEISVGIESESPGWLPGKDSWTSAGLMVMHAIHDPLMANDEDGKTVPYLAESLTPNADLSEFTVKLRPNIKFHDGTPLNADALVTVFRDYLKAPGKRTTGSLVTVQSLEKVDDLTAVYKLDGPNAAFPDLLTGAIGMPFSPTAAKAAGDNEYSTKPVGTGPFVFSSWTRDSQFVATKNPSYWQQGKPYLDKITFRPIPDEDSRLASLTAGGVQVMHTVRQAQNLKRAADQDDTLKALIDIGNASAEVMMNLGKPPTNDRRVRLALGHAVSQKQLIAAQGLEGLAPESTQIFAEDSPYYSKAAAQKYPKQDVNRAKQLIQEYVNDPARSDGKPVGQPVTLAITCTAGVASLNDLVVLYQQYFKEIGVVATLDFVDQATLINKAVGTAPDYKASYDVTCWRSGTDADPDVLYNTFYTPNAAANVNDLDNPRVKELLDIGRRSAVPAERQKAYQEMMEIFASEGLYIFHGGLVTAVGAKDEVKGIADWQIPGGKKGEGYPGSMVHFVEVWLDR